MTTLTDIEPLAQALRDLTPGEPLAHGPVTVIPLLAPGAPDPGWLTLAEARDAVTIEEVSEAGAVPTLRLTSAADRPVLLLDGEELIGARQNRVLNTTVLVAAGARLTIPVSCVEQGRWAYASRRFAAGDSTLYASLRAQKAAQVTRSLRTKGKHASDQGEIWARLSLKAADHEVQSPTGRSCSSASAGSASTCCPRPASSSAPGRACARATPPRSWWRTPSRT
jgi:hypothetical protein